MTQTFDEHQIRGAVERMAAGAATAPLPREAILAGGTRRRGRRRVGAVGATGAVVLAATLAVSATWPAASGGGSASPAGGWPTTTNSFTERLGHTLEQALPGAKVVASMFADTDPAVRHERRDVFPLRITYRGHVSDAFLTIWASTPIPQSTGWTVKYCQGISPQHASDCMSKDLADGGTVNAELLKGAGSWTSTSATLGEGTEPLTIVQGTAEIPHSGATAILQVLGGAHSNDSALTPSAIGKALGDPRLTALLDDFSAHPERDPYGPLAPVPGHVVASGTVGTHTWSLTYSIVSRTAPQDITKVVNDCNYWDYTVDGKSMAPDHGYVCGTEAAKNLNRPPTDKSDRRDANLLWAGATTPSDVVGSILTSAVLPGTASVEATFDDSSPKLTAKVFTTQGDVPYFVLVKPDSSKPDWRTATVRCLDANGKELGKLYFAPGTLAPATK